MLYTTKRNPFIMYNFTGHFNLEWLLDEFTMEAPLTKWKLNFYAIFGSFEGEENSGEESRGEWLSSTLFGYF